MAFLGWINDEWCRERGVDCTPERARSAVIFGGCILLATAVVLGAVIVAALTGGLAVIR